MKFYFESESAAWAFAKDIVSKGDVVTDYGVDQNRLVNIYFIEVEPDGYNNNGWIPCEEPLSSQEMEDQGLSWSKGETK